MPSSYVSVAAKRASKDWKQVTRADGKKVWRKTEAAKKRAAAARRAPAKKVAPKKKAAVKKVAAKKAAPKKLVKKAAAKKARAGKYSRFEEPPAGVHLCFGGGCYRPNYKGPYKSGDRFVYKGIEYRYRPAKKSWYSLKPLV